VVLQVAYQWSLDSSVLFAAVALLDHYLTRVAVEKLAM
jgi:hypothetical protein